MKRAILTVLILATAIVGALHYAGGRMIELNAREVVR